MLLEGTPAPEFSGVTHKGEEISLDDFKGQRLVLWFFPKANTPG